jgi:hypothetical protein
MLPLEWFVLVASLLSLNLWLALWVSTPWAVRIGLAVAATLLVYGLESTLIAQSLMVWQGQLQSLQLPLAIWLCFESWLLLRLRQRWSIPGVSGVFAIVYLQLSLYQSGWLDVSFQGQTLVFLVFLVVLGLLHVYLQRTLRQPGFILYGCAFGVWLISWISQCHWSQSPPVIVPTNLRDSLLVVVLVMGVLLTTHALFRLLRHLSPNQEQTHEPVH